MYGEEENEGLFDFLGLHCSLEAMTNIKTTQQYPSV